MTYTVRFAPEAADQVEALYRYLASPASPAVAAGYVEAIVPHCEASPSPRTRGTMRGDIRPGLRTSGYKNRAVIATSVDDEAQRVTILGLFYGGQDCNTILSGSDNA